MNKIVIYTAIFGNKDSLYEAQYPVPNADYVCFTDNKKVNSSVWDVRYKSIKYDSPILSAREYKLKPHELFPEYDISIWIDGNFTVISDLTPLLCHAKFSDVVTFDHNDPSLFDARDCIYQELDALIKFKKADPETMTAQVNSYKLEGYPEHNGLSVTGFLIREHNKESVMEFMNSWWKEVSHRSVRDQLSFNYVAWKGGHKIHMLPGNIRNNKWVQMRNHNDANWYRR